MEFIGNVHFDISDDKKELAKQKFSELLFKMWKNKAITELYEPGSTSKIITTAMAFEEGVTNPNEVFFCGGSLKVDGYGAPIHCHDHRGHGSLPYAKSLQQSCNPTLMQASWLIGAETFYKYLQAFGFTAVTGIDLPGEAEGLLHDKSAIGPTELATIAFGQTFTSTTIQTATAFSALINGGNLVKPYVVSQIVDDDGAVEIAGRCRGTPRIANNLLRRVRDYAQIRAGNFITGDVARESLGLLEIDPNGLDDMDRRILETICVKFSGGPVGLSTIAVSVGEEPDTIEEAYEPFLIMEGYIERTPKGRVATSLAFERLGLSRS